MENQEPDTYRPSVTHRTYCVWTHPDGERCRGLTRLNSKYCYWHDPDVRKERETRQLKSPLPQTLQALAAADSTNPPPMPEPPELLRAVGRYLATAELPDVGRAHALSTIALHRLQRETRAVQRELKAVQSEITRLETEIALDLAQEAKQASNPESKGATDGS